ncbi:hypothetical protein [Corallococcus macrosporus]|uniref:Uncharacterized protein n=1 Tax=Corallococcus macrosporus DSM 14697 TaxID=1189310 RepID=A0A250JKW0_9BACT|nr:hypothetical protein [Corallococcus macrosporus]ATB44519.1 hypothetical protein MYMAC_000090 [Corallococcus macrosporus DSM 14697]
MASSDTHLAWDPKTLNHTDRPSGFGCLWRHTITDNGGWSAHPCNHMSNCYKVSLNERSALYNKDHQAIARRMKLVQEDFGLSGKAKKRIWKRFPVSDNSKRKLTLSDFFDRARQSLYWLRRGPEGWHIGVKHLDPVPNQALKKGNRPQFQPRQNQTQGGHGAFYPYEHNYHHLIPVGAVEEWVIGKGGSGSPARSDQVVKLILISRWNIHNEKNMVLLPQQEFEALIVGLPAHCPWGVPAHAAYQTSLKDRLRELRGVIDRAVIEKQHPRDLKAAILEELNELSESLLEQVKQMRAGVQLGAVDV